MYWIEENSAKISCTFYIGRRFKEREKTQLRLGKRFVTRYNRVRDR